VRFRKARERPVLTNPEEVAQLGPSKMGEYSSAVMKLAVAAVVAGHFAYVPLSAKAHTFFDDLLGVVTDPFKLNAASKTLGASAERSLIQLTALEGTASAHVQDRLQEMRQILAGAISGGEAAVSDAINKMRDLEDKIDDDAVTLIYRAECKADVLMRDRTQRAFAALIDDLNKAHPGVTLFGVPIITVSANKVTIDDPDKAYAIAYKQVFDDLNAKLTETSPANSILSAYQNLEQAARYTRCYYIDQAYAVTYTKEINDLERLSVPWITVVDVNVH
jgi:hypothetical protein